MPEQIKIGSHTVELSKQDKILFPESGITKGDLVAYYQKVAEIMLPFLKDRPLILHRYPNGIIEKGFIQQEISDYFPDWIERIAVKKEGGTVNHVLCQNAETLIYLANQACISFHPWLSRKDKLDYPDLLIFDLDAEDGNFNLVRQVAQLLRKFLVGLKLNPFVKTTGSTGLHVVIPTDRSWSFEEVRGFAQKAVAVLAEQEPDKVTIEQRKEKRNGRVFLDYMRNSYGQSAVAPYSIRAKSGAPIATPLDWDEIAEKRLTSQKFTLKNIFQRLSRKKNPWEEMLRNVHSLGAAQKKLNELNKS